MSDKTTYYNGADWVKAFKDKMNDTPKQKKYKGKVIHQQSMFVFEVDGTRYEVICPNAKCG
jgi:hypothetical protein